jgi:hypothetical protein
MERAILFKVVCPFVRNAKKVFVCELTSQWLHARRCLHRPAAPQFEVQFTVAS